MMAKQKKPTVKIAVALISVLGMTAIGVTSAFAGANKQDQRGNYTVECQAYSDSNYQNHVASYGISNRACNLRVRKNSFGYYWQNAGP